MKVVIEKIERVNMPAGKDGKPWVSVRVFINGKMAFCGDAQWNREWKAGDEVDVETFEKTDAKGRVWVNIAPPAKAAIVKENNEIMALLKGIDKKLDLLLDKDKGIEDLLI